MAQKALGSIVGLLYTGTYLVQGKEFCFGVNNEQYRCEMGYCCGETECCTYYYELWWFWLVWTLIIMLSCCCAYRHRRVKMRLQQEQRQREISLMAYQGASSSFIAPPPLNLRFWTDCKLPDYEEVVGHPPTPPPPYSEMPPETAPAAVVLSGGQSDAAVVLEPALQDEGEQNVGQEEQVVAASGPDRPGRPKEEEEPEVPLEEEPGTRRRHVTGDSGIEVCVCRLDVDENSGLEEEDEAERLCRGGAGAACCSERQAAVRHKERSSERQAQPASTGDRLV
ncbi:WW domain-binding protein 1 isoform X2 [Denticeps clupeoides]|uniref:WW domain binding protein 1 n=1 Tax=Denticeps clupeoides TaxID=299321 RepID=A0AAY4CDU1_9TELE|nr:WW domain-binding protein 1-like isoform X2 [Denticeps clupeoides]